MRFYSTVLFLVLLPNLAWGHVRFSTTPWVVHHPSAIASDVPKIFRSKIKQTKKDLEAMGYTVVTKASEILQTTQEDFLVLEADELTNQIFVEAYNEQSSLSVITSLLGIGLCQKSLSQFIIQTCATLTVGTFIAQGFNLLSIPFIKRRYLPNRILIHHAQYDPNDTSLSVTYGRRLEIPDILRLYEERHDNIDMVHDRLNILNNYNLFATAALFLAIPHTPTWLQTAKSWFT